MDIEEVGNVERMTMKTKLYDLLVSISWADLARTYFGKRSSWMYNKINGCDNDGNPTEFTPEEVQQLKGALIDLSERIRRAAELL